MTDNEIIKAEALIKKLEEAYEFYYAVSRSMPYDIDTTLRETAICLEKALNEIHHQKSEIARLESAYTKEYVRVEHLTERLKNARAEAFKEFASELKQMSCGYSFESDESNQTYQMIDTEDIDDLLERKLTTDVTTIKEKV